MMKFLRISFSLFSYQYANGMEELQREVPGLFLDCRNVKSTLGYEDPLVHRLGAELPPAACSADGAMPFFPAYSPSALPASSSTSHAPSIPAALALFAARRDLHGQRCLLQGCLG